MDDSLHELRSLVQSHPIIDNHAHNLLSSEQALNYEEYPLESITSEAQGEALKQAPQTLSHYLAVKQLATLFSCEPTWAAVKAARQKWVSKDYRSLVRKCLEGTETLLLDDLIADIDIEDYKWHDQFVNSKAGTKRIVRIEAVASRILNDFWSPGGKYHKKQLSQDYEAENFQALISEFRQRMHGCLLDPMVAGFKSVICYRTGLDIKVQNPDNISVTACQESLQKLIAKGPPFRIAAKPLNDLLVRLVLEVIRGTAGMDNQSRRKPIQFHTGLGDNDIDLVLANPAYLQPLIEYYKEVDFVLLHSSYPYTREAGYLASAYPNVFLDLGEVYSMVSKDAENSILRQSMELTPTSRLLWSTDGHFHPETYWLSNKQFRDTLGTVRENNLTC